MKIEKAQSAMEYLMTYGWAILIIAVVLGALFSLGVFSGSSLLGSSCVASPGFYCTNPTLSTAGALSFTFGQNEGSPMYNVELACTATTNTLGLPANSNAWSVIYANGLATIFNTNANVANAVTLAPGQSISVTGLPCFTATGTQLGQPTLATIGTTLSGYILVNYTTTPSCAVPISSPSTSCVWYTTKAATLNIKVS